MNVSSVDFSFASPTANTTVEVNSSRVVTVRYLSAGAGVAGKTISFGTTRGTVSPAQAVTDANGDYRMTNAEPGTYGVVATAVGFGASASVSG